jgi:hypothetical protein
LSLYSAYVKRYEFTARPKRNWFAMSNQLYINFDNYKDDAISYVDGIKINVKNNEYKIIAHKGMIQELGQFDTSARVETS